MIRWLWHALLWCLFGNPVGLFLTAVFVLAVVGTLVWDWWFGSPSWGPRADDGRQRLFTYEQRMEIIARDGASCAYCGATVSVEPIVEPAPARSSDEFGEMLAAWDADLARLDVAEGELRAMSSDMAVLRSRLAAFETVNRPGGDGGPADFGSPAAAVRLAADQFAGQLDMHPRVWAGLHRFEYPEPTHLYLDLVRLAGMVARWQAGDGPLERLAGEAGLPGWSPSVSPTALAQYPSDYVLSWDGVEVVFGAHFGRGARTAANCYRAYVWLDEGRRRAVVGWVGPHLRDTTNN